MDPLSFHTRFYIMQNVSHLPEAVSLLGTSSPASLSSRWSHFLNVQISPFLSPENTRLLVVKTGKDIK